MDNKGQYKQVENENQQKQIKKLKWLLIISFLAEICGCIAHIAIGFVYKDECPVEDQIPIYLIGNNFWRQFSVNKNTYI